jgi:hypothetical protein
MKEEGGRMKDEKSGRRSRARIALADMFSPRIFCRKSLRIGKPDRCYASSSPALPNDRYGQCTATAGLSQCAVVLVLIDRGLRGWRGCETRIKNFLRLA